MLSKNLVLFREGRKHVGRRLLTSPRIWCNSKPGEEDSRRMNTNVENPMKEWIPNKIY